MYKWSTDQVEPKHRFDHWREVRARGLFGVTAELEPERRPQFSGEFSDGRNPVGHLSLARRLITRHLSNAALSPAFVAELLGISVRHLYALFEATGTSFAQTVTAQRIGESRRLLKEAPERSISQIAFASGFESLATFYRAFQAAHGASPGDFRAQGNS